MQVVESGEEQEKNQAYDEWIGEEISPKATGGSLVPGIDIMTQQELYAHPGWETCTFEGAEMSTLRLGLKTTFREKLEWLEAAETLSLRMQAHRKQIQNSISDATQPK